MPLQRFRLPGPSTLPLSNLPLPPFHDTYSRILLSPRPTSPNSTHSTQLDTPVPPQSLCYQSNAHAFRHTWGWASVLTRQIPQLQSFLRFSSFFPVHAGCRLRAQFFLRLPLPTYFVASSPHLYLGFRHSDVFVRRAVVEQELFSPLHHALD